MSALCQNICQQHTPMVTSPIFVVAPRPECREDPECPQSEACINERCIDPCIVNNPCAPQATCQTRAHHPVCTCPEGYGGDPYRQCYRPECRTDNDCPVNKACINENCLNPCLNSDRPCGRGAECIVEVGFTALQYLDTFIIFCLLHSSTLPSVCAVQDCRAILWWPVSTLSVELTMTVARTRPATSSARRVSPCVTQARVPRTPRVLASIISPNARVTKDLEATALCHASYVRMKYLVTMHNLTPCL